MRNKSWYDAQCKRLLSNKQVLLNILKRVVEEYKDLPDEEILKLISEPMQSVKDDGVYLETRNVEDISIPDQPIEYDVLLYAGLPESEEMVGLMINLEVQGDQPSYPIMKRGAYYLARLIARQKGHPYGFQKSDYGKLKKVIGIWIVREKTNRKGILNVYQTQETRYGKDAGYPKQEYDLMQMVVISPEDEASKTTGVVEFLSLLFGNHNAEDSAERLEKEYGVVLSTQEREEMKEMCNWSMAHYLDGQEKGRLAGIEEGKTMGRTEGKTEEKKQTILEMLKDGVAEKLIMKYTRCTKRQIEEARSCLN